MKDTYIVCNLRERERERENGRERERKEKEEREINVGSFHVEFERVLIFV